MKSIFEYRNNLVEDFSRFSQSFVKPRADDIANYLNDEKLRKKFWPEPLLQINPHYKMGESVSSLVANGILDAECASLFLNKKTGNPLQFYVHQSRAISAAARHENYILTTGTGSGKSLSFFVPIVDRILREKKKDPTPRTRAIIMYPMNALANSQLEEIKGFLSNDPNCDVTVGRYTGQESSDERKRLADNPPDILLTNYMMMELILTRYEDVDIKVIEHSKHLEFLVLDELHTYRGRQGADVALLIRRLRFRVEANEMICIGTSATMTSIGSDEDQRTAVAQTASVLFGTKFNPDNVITETLERATKATVDINLTTLLKSRMADDSPFPSDLEALKADPLAVWTELNLSLTHGSDSEPYRRANPRGLSDIYKNLSEQADCSIETAKKKLNELLEIASSPDINLFAFKLHQFISGPSFLMTSLHPEGKRVVTVDEQLKAKDSDGDEVPLFRTYFCRDCGQEFIPTYLSDDIFTPRNLDERPDEDDDSVEWGFLVPYPDDPDDFDYLPEDISTLPSSWREYKKDFEVVVKEKQKYVPRIYHVNKAGKVESSAPIYCFIPGTVRFCPCCGVEMEDRAREQNKLTGLSGEGRSSATTIMTMNLLSQMFEDDSNQKKILGFVDNRQDAALQSGHFNDFVNRAMIRGAAIAAIEDLGRSCSVDEMGRGIIDILGFSDPCDKEAQNELYIDPDKPAPVRKRNEQIARDVLKYRLLNEMKRSWKYSNPTVFHLGLLKLSYRDFDEMMSDTDKISKYEVFSSIPDGARKRLMKTILNEMVGQYCISDHILDLTSLRETKGIASGILNSRWCFDEGEDLFEGNRLSFDRVGPQHLKGAYHFLSCSQNSKLGRLLRRDKIWVTDRQFAGKTKKQIADIVGKLTQELLDFSNYYGIVEKKFDTGEKKEFYQVDSAAIIIERGDGIPEKLSWKNEYFQALYESIGKQFTSRSRGLFSFTSAEHTAQVSSDEREILEKRFRGEQDYDPLPVLYCSPTMELGIDISSLNTVYMRNVPPTPANYAQRSGRAGRSGQAALVVTYCASQSPHDQWYFKHSDDMVSGAVVTPSLDLSNKDLIDSHLMAIWFAAAKCRINSAISEVIDTENDYEIRAEIKQVLTRPSLADEAYVGIKDLTNTLSEYLTPEKAPWYTEGYERNLVINAYERFHSSFNNWITLVKDTKKQMQDAYEKLHRGLTAKDRKVMQKIFDDATVQLSLLTNPPRGANTASSDFYVYRYLAGQGVLPGYNFPRLPIIAWIPQVKSVHEDNDERMVSISRSRFLALSEFGPQSIIYHRGNSFRVYKVKLNASTAMDNQNGQLVLSTRSVVICSHCGFGIVSPYDGTVTDDRCPCCNAVLDKSKMISDLYRIETVETKSASAITSNDEERMRRGYDLQTFYAYDKADTAEVAKAVVDDNGNTIAVMRYIPNATIYKVNKGWKNRNNKSDCGFFINPSTGVWKKESTDSDGEDGEEKDFKQKIVPYAEDRKNCLILELNLQGSEGNSIAPTLQSAFSRGIANVFQIEGSELAVELLTDNGDSKSILFYESSEGGAGVLSRIVSSEKYLRTICLNALEVMHYSFDKGKTKLLVSDLRDEKPDCICGCYSCLLSYYNQTSHADIDRRNKDVLNVLVSMANGQFGPAAAKGASGSDFAVFLETNSIRIVDLVKDKAIRSGEVLPYFSNSSKVAFFLEQPVQSLRDYLEQRGIVVCTIGSNESEWASNLDEIRSVVEGGRV